MFTWEVHNQKNHSESWYIGGLIVMLFFVAYGIIMHLYALVPAIFLFVGIYIYAENNSDAITHVEFDMHRIVVDDVPYNWKHFSQFAIIEVLGTPKYLRLFPGANGMGIVDVPLVFGMDIATLRKGLQGILSENTEAKMTNTDAIVHFTKL